MSPAHNGFCKPNEKIGAFSFAKKEREYSFSVLCSFYTVCHAWLSSLAFFAVSLFRLASVLPGKKNVLVAPVFLLILHALE